MGLAAKMETKYLNSQLEVIRQKGILAPDEQVLAMVGFFKRTQLVMLFGLLARMLQRRYHLIVTDRRVVWVHVPAFIVHGGGYHQHAALKRPCAMQLPCEPKAMFQMGAKVMLPPEFAALVGRPYAYVMFGLDAQQAFDIMSRA